MICEQYNWTMEQIPDGLVALKRKELLGAYSSVNN